MPDPTPEKPEVIDIRQCYDTEPKQPFTVVDLCDGPGLLPYSVLFDDLHVFEQCRILDAWYDANWDTIPEVPF